MNSERVKLNERLKELEIAEEDALNDVKDAMGGVEGTEEVGTMLVDGKPKTVVTWKISRGRRLDQKLLAERFPQIWDVCKQPAQSRSFKVLP